MRRNARTRGEYKGMETRAPNSPPAGASSQPIALRILSSAFLRYSGAVMDTFVIALLRLGLQPWLGTRAPFGLFFLSVVFTSWFLGMGPGLLSVALGLIVGLYFTVGPKAGLNLSPAEWVGVINFVLTGILIVVLNEKQRRAKFLVDANVSALNEKQILLEQKQVEVEALNTRLQRAMQETHHRVKNNLQVVSALAEMQVEPGELTIPASAIQRIGTHVRALATIHDLLTLEAKENHTADTLHARTILEKLIPLVRATVGDRAIHYTADDIMLSSKQGTALALLVNELVSNAIKHGKGEIEITLRVEGETARLEVCDDGPGFPAGFNPKRSANTGLELIDSVGRWDLGGAVTFENGKQGGARVTVAFPTPVVPTLP